MNKPLAAKQNLVNLIKINGPISVGEFIKESLFHPKFGYYQKQNHNSAIFGSKGDFITSPEISQVFGELIAAYLLNLWQNHYSEQKITLVEMGAGNGTLIKDFLNFAQEIPDFLESFNINIVEISPKLQEVQKENLKKFKINWYQDFNLFYQENNKRPIFFISNELFDCFAIEQFIKNNNNWAKKMVTIDEHDNLQFTSKPYAPTFKTPLDLPKNAVFEHSFEAESFMDNLSKAVNTTRGICLIFDYGYIENEFKNTLQALKNHKYCDPLLEVGNCDITSLVNFKMLQDVAQKNNLQTSLITQKEFLESLGIETRREKLLENKAIEKQKEINSSINRLIDKEQMGSLFKVLISWL